MNVPDLETIYVISSNIEELFHTFTLKLSTFKITSFREKHR